jgi:hypothetical protein
MEGDELSQKGLARDVCWRGHSGYGVPAARHHARQDSLEHARHALACLGRALTEWHAPALCLLPARSHTCARVSAWRVIVCVRACVRAV